MSVGAQDDGIRADAMNITAATTAGDLQNNARWKCHSLLLSFVFSLYHHYCKYFVKSVRRRSRDAFLGGDRIVTFSTPLFTRRLGT